MCHPNVDGIASHIGLTFYRVSCSSPNGLFARSAVLGRCDALLVASAMTAPRVWVLWWLARLEAGGSRNGLSSSRGGLVTGVTGSSTVLLLFSVLNVEDCFKLLPTRTTCARTAVAVFALFALFRKVEPTLNVLPAGLGGTPFEYLEESIAGTGGVVGSPPELPLPIDLTLTMAALARMPVCAGVTTTPAFP